MENFIFAAVIIAAIAIAVWTVRRRKAKPSGTGGTSGGQNDRRTHHK